MGTQPATHYGTIGVSQHKKKQIKQLSRFTVVFWSDSVRLAILLAILMAIRSVVRFNVALVTATWRDPHRQEDEQASQGCHRYVYILRVVQLSSPRIAWQAYWADI